MQCPVIDKEYPTNITSDLITRYLFIYLQNLHREALQYKLKIWYND